MRHARCAQAAACDAWERAGSYAALPHELEQHTQGCAPCRERVDEVRRVRALFGGVGPVPLQPQRLSEIRFLLTAQVRQRASRRQGHRWLGWWAVPACALALFGVALALRFVPAGPARAPVVAHELAQIQLRPGAQGRLLSSGPDEAYALLDGSAEFAVRSLRAGERFRVLVGASVLEVRGTRFSASAEGGLLRAVSVSEGAVLVTHLGQSTLVVGGGNWSALDGAASAPGERVADPPRAASASSKTLERAPAQADQGHGVVSHGVLRRAAPSSAPAQRKTSGQLSSPATPGDERFAAARALLREGRPAQAARAFAALATDTGADEQLRAEAEYWSAESSRKSGDLAGAEAAAERYLHQAPGGWHAPHAALLLGDVLLARGQVARALPWLRSAAEQGSGPTRARAEALIAEAPHE